MDAVQFGLFVASLRKEKGLTQKELADRLHVTDKAVSKWETGKGFPDLKLLPDLARELDVSLVELIQGERTASPTLSKEEAGQVVAQAMDHSQKVTARRYLRLLRWLLIVMAMAAVYNPAVSLVSLIALHVFAPQTGVIGGADGPTQVLVSSTEGDWIVPILLAACAAIAMTCLILAIRVWRLEKKLK